MSPGDLKLKSSWNEADNIWNWSFSEIRRPGLFKVYHQAFGGDILQIMSTRNELWLEVWNFQGHLQEGDKSWRLHSMTNDSNQPCLCNEASITIPVGLEFPGWLARIHTHAWRVVHHNSMGAEDPAFRTQVHISYLFIAFNFFYN